MLLKDICCSCYVRSNFFAQHTLTTTAPERKCWPIRFWFDSVWQSVNKTRYQYLLTHNLFKIFNMISCAASYSRCTNFDRNICFADAWNYLNGFWRDICIRMYVRAYLCIRMYADVYVCVFHCSGAVLKLLSRIELFRAFFKWLP